MRFGPEEPPASTISLTPLIDVVFILLVFFMLASSFLDWRSVDLRLAGPAIGAPQSGESLLVEVGRGGRLSLNGANQTTEALQAEVARRIAERPALPVILRPAPDVSLQTAVDVLDLLTRAGASDISLTRTSQ